MNSDYINPDAPDPALVSAVCEHMKRGGQMELPNQYGNFPDSFSNVPIGLLAESYYPQPEPPFMNAPLGPPMLTTPTVHPMMTPQPAPLQTTAQSAPPVLTSMFNQPMWTAPLGLYDEFNFNGLSLTPQQILINCIRDKFKPRTLSRDQTTGIITVHERNGRDVEVGDFKIKGTLFVNPDGSMRFEAFFCKIVVNDKEYPIVIPFLSFVKHDVLQFLWMLVRNPDCPDKYIIMAFYLELQRMAEIKFLITPDRSGWEEKENVELEFASGLSVHPHLAPYYPEDVRERKLVDTTRALVDIAEEYAEALPKFWQYKLLVAIRIASLLLYFFAKEGIIPDQLFIVEPASESAAKAAIALMKTQNYESQVVLPLTATKTAINEALNKSNDGMVVIRDSSYAEDWKKRDNGIQALLDDLHGSNGNENGSRHLTAIVSNNPGNLSSELPAMFLNLTEQVLVGNPDELQRLSGEFDSALIKAIVSDPTNMKAFIKSAICISKIESKTIRNSENVNSKRLIRGGLSIMEHFKLFTSEESKEIYQWLKKGSEPSRDSSTDIVNDFREVFNRQLFTWIKLMGQYGPPYYECGKNMAFIDEEFINFEVDVVDKIILRGMKKTQKRLKLMQALQSCNLLHGKKSYKRDVEVEVASGEMKTVSVYSVPKSLLNAENRGRLDELKYPGYFIAAETVPVKGFTQRITNTAGTKITGVQQQPGMYLNWHQWVSEESQSGKTRYICEQALSVAENGEKVIIIDHNNSLEDSELKKHLGSEFIGESISRWDVLKQGLPVNPANLDNSDTVPEKKQRIFSVLAAATRVLGEVQEKVLRKRIAEMLKKQNQILDISDILNYLDEKDEIQKALRNKLEDILDELKDLPKNNDSWGEFLSKQKQVVIISMGSDDVGKTSHITDMLLASLYSYKQHHPESKYTVILDECQDLHLDTDGPVDVMLRKGSKHGFRMMLASQEFSATTDKLGKIIGNCGTRVFFHPKTDNISDISTLTGVDKATLANLEQGHCVYHGLAYNEYEGKNKKITLIGKTYIHHKK